MKFTAEVKEVKASKTASNDCEYRVVLITDDAQVLKLNKYIANETIEVEINNA